MTPKKRIQLEQVLEIDSFTAKKSPNSDMENNVTISYLWIIIHVYHIHGK